MLPQFVAFWGFGRLTRLHCWISCPAYKHVLPRSQNGVKRLFSPLSDLMTVVFSFFFFFCSPPPAPSGIYSSLKDPLLMGGGVCSAPLGGRVCSTSLSLGGGMCSTPLSSGLLQSHVSSLSLPSVNAISNTQVSRFVLVTKYNIFSFINCLYLTGVIFSFTLII